MPVPVHELATTEQYLAVLDGHPTKFAPGERFSYCNGGFVVLALIAERASGVAVPRARAARVCAPAGMDDTEFLRSDELPGRAARRLPRRRRRLAHQRVPPAGARQRRRRHLLDRRRHQRVLERALRRPDRAARAGSPRWSRPRSDVPTESKRYGLGFWLHESRDVVDARGLRRGRVVSAARTTRGTVTHTVISNTSDGAWPIARALDELLF